MSDSKRIERRSLFNVFRRVLGQTEAETSDSGEFSLSAFYERRPAPSLDSRDLPHFRLREGLIAVETTKVGAGIPESSPTTTVREPV